MRGVRPWPLIDSVRDSKWPMPMDAGGGGGGLTMVPTPRWMRSRPSVTRRLMASRMVFLDTAYVPASAVSAGMAWPGDHSPADRRRRRSCASRSGRVRTSARPMTCARRRSSCRPARRPRWARSAAPRQPARSRAGRSPGGSSVDEQRDRERSRPERLITRCSADFNRPLLQRVSSLATLSTMASSSGTTGSQSLSGPSTSRPPFMSWISSVIRPWSSCARTPSSAMCCTTSCGG